MSRQKRIRRTGARRAARASARRLRTPVPVCLRLHRGPSRAGHYPPPDRPPAGGSRDVTGRFPCARVAVARCTSYQQEQVLAALAGAMSLLGGMEAFVRPGATVLVKPNLLIASRPEDAVCTHPSVVRAVIILAREAGAGTVLVGDSPSLGRGPSVAARLGLDSVCRQTGARLVPFDASEDVPFPAGVTCKRFPLTPWVQRVDAVINVPKLKTHGLMTYTGAVKNLFGCLPGPHKPRFHLRMREVDSFASMLVDLYLLVRPVLSIMDGITAMEGNGPRNGTPRSLGVLLAGADAVAVDAVASAILGIDPLRIPTTAAARRRGAGASSLAGIEVTGVPVAQVAVTDFRWPPGARVAAQRIPPAAYELFRNQLTARAEVMPGRCTGCGHCHDHCPAGAIVMDRAGHDDPRPPGTAGDRSTARIRQDLCIRCYCCQEVCPANAVSLQEPRLLRFLSRLSADRTPARGSRSR